MGRIEREDVFEARLRLEFTATECGMRLELVSD